VSVEFLQAAIEDNGSSSYTFSSQNLGVAASNRYIILEIAARAVGITALDLVSVSVGGVSARIVVQDTIGNRNVSRNTLAIAIALVPIGTSGDIVVAFSRTALRCSIGVSRTTALASDVEFDTASASTSTVAASQSLTLDTSAGGFAVSSHLLGDTLAATWSGLTETYETSVGNFYTHTGANLSDTDAETARPISVSWPGTGEPSSIVAASWAVAPPPSGGLIKFWDGTAWVAKPVKWWSGSAWVVKPLKRWNGSAWV